MTRVDSVREACGSVAARSAHVGIDDAALAPYAAALPALPEQEVPPAPPREAAARAALTLCLDAINFGSGWFPTLRKRAGESGYTTVARAIGVRFAASGPWPARELARIDAHSVAAVLGQDPAHELMELYAAALRELGARIDGEYGGDWLGPVRAAGGSAVAMVELAAGWPAWHDVSTHDGAAVPFYKRAQILAADLHEAGLARSPDLGCLTMFADNLVPHVLRLDGVLRFAAELVSRIEAGELLEHGSPEEVEIRANAVEAVERIVRLRPDLTAQRLDRHLWNRGGEARYKASPRHRARCTAY